MAHRPKHIIEYILLRAVAGLLRILPYRGALFVGWCIAWIAFHLVRFRVRDAQQRIRTVLGPDLSKHRVAQIAWLSWRNFIFSIIEAMRLDHMKLSWLESVYENRTTIDKLKQHANTGKGAIVATWHMGSWEMAAVRVHLNQIPLFTIAATQKNPLTDQYLNVIRKAPGIGRIARGSGTMKAVLRKLKQGEFLAILPDVRMRQSGVEVNFLGGKANVGAGMARFAMQANIPIIPVRLRRQGWTRHSMVAFDPIWPDSSAPKDEETLRLTQRVMDIIDTAIRETPEQWFWFNKRWILDPIKSGSSSTT